MLSKQPSCARMVFLACACIVTACAESGPVVPSHDDHASLASAVPWSGNPELSQLLAAIRDTTVGFHDEAAARAAGYRPSIAGCESSSAGAMGIHYGHPALLGLIPGSRPTNGSNSIIDPMRPEVLMFEPQPDGSRRLVGIEYVVYRGAWDAAHSEPPTLLGIPFDEMFGSKAHGHADHYELHVWLWRHNPLGIFAPWNPKVSC